MHLKYVFVRAPPIVYPWICRVQFGLVFFVASILLAICLSLGNRAEGEVRTESISADFIFSLLSLSWNGGADAVSLSLAFFWWCGSHVVIRHGFSTAVELRSGMSSVLCCFSIKCTFARTFADVLSLLAVRECQRLVFRCRRILFLIPTVSDCWDKWLLNISSATCCGEGSTDICSCTKFSTVFTKSSTSLQCLDFVRSRLVNGFFFTRANRNPFLIAIFALYGLSSDICMDCSSMP